MKPKETEFLMYTNKINVTSINFLGTEFTLADCGGQKTHLDEYISKYPKDVFSGVTKLIYVFDIEYIEDYSYHNIYIDIIDRLEIYSEKAKIFILVHKIDKIKKDNKMEKFRKCRELINKLTPSNNLESIFFTSIWDDTLYNAWSQIVQSMIPVLKEISQSITEFGETNQCDEIVLVERDTFLIVANYEKIKRAENVSYGRYERIAGIFKTLKINCKNEQLESIRIQNDQFCAVLRNYTSNTYILIIKKEDSVHINSVLFNLDVVRKTFERPGELELQQLAKKF